MNPSLKFAFDEIFRKLDEIEARWDQRFPDTRVMRGQRVEDLRVGTSRQIDGEVVADNWGGLFEHVSVRGKRVYEPMKEQLAVVAHIVADNWGGLFEEPACVMDERVYESVASDSASPPPMKVQLANDVAAAEHTSTDPDVPACVSPALTASTAASVSVRENVSVETSPAEDQRQIQELEKPSPSLPQPAAAEDEANALQQLLEREYKYLPESLTTLFLSKGYEAHGLNPRAVPPTPRPPMRLHYTALSDSSVHRALDSVFPDEVYNLAAHPGPFRSARLTCYMDEHQAEFARWLQLLVDKGRVRAALPDFLTAAAAGPDPLHAAFLDAVPSLGCVVTMAAGVDRIHLTLCARRGIVVTGVGEIFSVDVADPVVELLIDKLRRVAAADRCVRAGLWPAQGNTPEALDPPLDTPRLLQLVVPKEEAEVPNTLLNKCSINGLILKQSCFWLPSCCRWDAVLHRKHTPWPPPTELRLVSFDAGLRPLPWPSFNMVERNSVTYHFGQLWKPPWYVPIQEIARCVLAELVESWKYLMVICWNFGAIKIYLEMSEHMASVDPVCSPCNVEVVDFGEFDDERPAKPEALVAAVHSGDNSHIIHFPAGGYSGFILHLSGDEDMVASSPVISNVLLPFSLRLSSECAAQPFLAAGNGNPQLQNCGTGKGPSEGLGADGQAQEIIVGEVGWPMDGDNYSDDIYLCVTACFVDAGWKLQRRTVEVYLVHFIIDRRTGLLLGINNWGLIILLAYIHQGVFLVDGVHVLVAVTIAETGATLWTFPIVVWLSNWLCSRSLWKPPWELPALVEIIDAGLDDVVYEIIDAGLDGSYHEHEAEDVVPAESTVPNAAAPLALPKDIERQHFKTELKKQVIVQFTWDPGGSEFLHRLGGKPKLKKGGMSYGPWGWA